jgi:hypothetical protein
MRGSAQVPTPPPSYTPLHAPFRPLLWSCTAPSLRHVGCAVRRANSTVAAASTGSLPKAAASGRQPDALFRRHAARLGGDGGGVGDAGEGELPFPSIPHPDYEAERPQEQTAPEPDNPLPEGLPPNHPQEASQPALQLALHGWAVQGPASPMALLAVHAGAQGAGARGAAAAPRRA